MAYAALRVRASNTQRIGHTSRERNRPIVVGPSTFVIRTMSSAARIGTTLPGTMVSVETRSAHALGSNTSARDEATRKRSMVMGSGPSATNAAWQLYVVSS